MTVTPRRRTVPTAYIQASEATHASVDPIHDNNRHRPDHHPEYYTQGYRQFDERNPSSTNAPLEIGSCQSESSDDVDRGSFDLNIPVLRDVMVDDKNYVQFLLGDRQGHGGSNAASISRNQCGTFCAGFSFVGMIFLIWVGLMIEIQPIYIKGISPKQPIYIKKDYYRRLMNVETEQSTIQNSLKRAWFNSYGSLHLDEEQVINYDTRNLEGDEEEDYIQVYEMKYEAKSSFKAAAAYFLTMVLSFIYAQNPETFRLDLLQRLKQTVYLRQQCAVVYNNYRRRKYFDIPDESVNSMTGATVPNYEDTMSHINANENEERSRNFEASLDFFKKIKTSIPKSKRR